MLLGRQWFLDFWAWYTFQISATLTRSSLVSVTHTAYERHCTVMPPASFPATLTVASSSLGVLCQHNTRIEEYILSRYTIHQRPKI